MSKFLRTAAMVVGAVALVATGVGAFAAAAAGTSLAAGAATVTAALGVSASTLGAVAGLLSTAAALTAGKPKGTMGGEQTRFKADKNAGIPYGLGRTWLGGNIVYRQSTDGWSGKIKNDLQDFVVILSGGGPVHAIDAFYVDRELVNFSGKPATGKYADYMWMDKKLGATPEGALSRTAGSSNAPWQWTSAHKLSGYAAALWTIRFHKEGDLFAAGTPEPGWVGRWAKVYDPRLDSTYPGGSGACRALQENTYVFSENPYLHALTWCLGRWQNGKRILGVGAPIAAIDVAAFVEGANIADANAWKLGGVVYSNDSKWDVLKSMLQAGAGEPVRMGARISCMINAPRTSLATITARDLADGEVSVQATQERRSRINRIIPRYRSEAHWWEVVSAAPIEAATHVAEDGELRTREVGYVLVQDVNQAACLARYDIENSREFGPISLPLKPLFAGYRPGDCLTVDIDEVGLDNRKVLVLSRSIDPATGVVTLTCRSETDAKHGYALGQTGTAPPTPGVQGPPLVPVPEAAAWSITATALTANGVTTPAIVIEGAVEDPVLDAVRFEYRQVVPGQGEADGWVAVATDPTGVARKEISGLKSATQYQAAIAYIYRGQTSTRLILGPVTTAGARSAYEDGTPIDDLRPSEFGATNRHTWLRDTLPANADAHEEDLMSWLPEGGRLKRHGGLGMTLSSVEMLFNGEPMNLPWEDVQDEAIPAAQLAAEAAAQEAREAQQTADAANASAGQALDAIDALATDGLITATEKIQTLIQKDGQLEIAWTILDAQAGAFGITTERTAAGTARSAWLTYRNGLSPAWNDTTQDTPVDRATFRSKLADYDQALDNLQAAISNKAALTADWNQITGAGKVVVVTAADNFNARNDRNGAAIAAPTIATDGTSIDHANNTDGSVDISFEWSWGGSNNDIDGFLVYLRSSQSSTPYTIGTTPADETVYIVPPDKRAFILSAAAGDRYFTFGVRAYRLVDQDVSAGGRILSPIAQPSAGSENPYQPNVNVSFSGNVVGTVGGAAAAAVASGSAAANAGLNGDGTVKDGKVGTTAIVAGGVNGITTVSSSNNSVSVSTIREITSIAVGSIPASSVGIIVTAYGQVRVLAGQTLPVLRIYRVAAVNVAAYVAYRDANNGAVGPQAVVTNRNNTLANITAHQGGTLALSVVAPVQGDLYVIAVDPVANPVGGSTTWTMDLVGEMSVQYLKR